jgi:vacuolar-type H+-ATPase subunit E/Vma4
VSDPPVPAPGDPLQPLVAALLGRARRDADAMRAAADADAAQALARASAQASDILAEARAHGESDARAVMAGARSRAEREARAVLLAAQDRAYEEARQSARDAIRGLRDDPAYPGVVQALRARARAELGEGVELHPLPSGGVAAIAGDRRLEFCLDALADDLLERLGGSVAELWAP